MDILRIDTGVQLYDYQLDAVRRMKNGCILCGGVGSGKSRTSIAYYYVQNGGEVNTPEYIPMDDTNLPDLYIITTAKKRDSFEWQKELIPFLLGEGGLYHNKVVIDSWNNIKKYKEVKNAFFIFDEQRVVGYGAWTKSFLRISRSNTWILLSATPGDCWMDYVPVFIANGFFRNKTEFTREHVVYKNYAGFPQIDRYIGTGRLIRLRDLILVNMDFNRETVSHHEDIYVEYDVPAYKDICRNRWNPWEDKPIENASEFCYSLRKVVNSSENRQAAFLELMEKHPKAIIFYNFDYELEILRAIAEINSIPYSEWNGHKHQDIPEGERWMYLVQYNAGAEGWNCVKTDTMIFYSQNYSYKAMIQASGRIDRLNTPFKDLWYYHLKSRSGIDVAIDRALRNKKKFNERKFYGG